MRALPTAHPEIEQLAELYGGRLTVAKVDTDANPRLAKQYGIMSIPTVLFFPRAPNMPRRVVGYRNADQLADQLQIENGLNGGSTSIHRRHSA